VSRKRRDASVVAAALLCAAPSVIGIVSMFTFAHFGDALRGGPGAVIVVLMGLFACLFSMLSTTIAVVWLLYASIRGQVAWGRVTSWDSGVLACCVIVLSGIAGKISLEFWGARFVG
jgi:hypothetical protein